MVRWRMRKKMKTAGSLLGLLAAVLLAGQFCLTGPHAPRRDSAEKHAAPHSSSPGEGLAESAEVLASTDVRATACCHPPGTLLSKSQERNPALLVRPAPRIGNSPRLFFPPGWSGPAPLDFPGLAGGGVSPTAKAPIGTGDGSALRTVVLRT